MTLSEKDYHVLDALDRHEITTQRQLADHAGISLGQVNYVIKSLRNKGLVKLGNFRNNPNKMISYAYLLTPKGFEEKSKLAVRFVVHRLKEYNSLRQMLTGKLANIEQDGMSRIIIVGPGIIREFLVSIINEKHPRIALIGQCGSCKDLKDRDHSSFDVALLFDGSDDSPKAMSNATGIPLEKLMPLW